jgi:hypothetical protein
MFTNGHGNLLLRWVQKAPVLREHLFSEPSSADLHHLILLNLLSRRRSGFLELIVYLKQPFSRGVSKLWTSVFLGSAMMDQQEPTWHSHSAIGYVCMVDVWKARGPTLMLSVMLFFAYRDPARNVAIVNAFIVGLCVLAITPLLSLYTLDMRQLFPSYLIWVRSFVRLALAALLFYLRPQESVPKQS